jgi:hypothetical protein
MDLIEQNPTDPLSQMNRLCLSLTYIIDMAKIEGVITKAERDNLWSAIWSMAGARHTAEQASLLAEANALEAACHV